MELTQTSILRTLEVGVPNTAMKSFTRHLDDGQRKAVAAFVFQEFVACSRDNSRYHRAAAGWPDHEERYGVAYPFVLETIDSDAGEDALSEDDKMGLDLYRRSCVICHDLDVFRRRNAQPQSDDPTLLEARRGAEQRENNSWQGLLKAPNRQPTDSVVSESARGALPERGGDGEDYASAHDQPPYYSDLNAEEREGERLYQKNCAACHAADGSGKNWVGSFLNPHPTNFLSSRSRSELSAERIIQSTLEGIPGTSMPAFKETLARDEIEAIEKYIRRSFFHQWQEGP